MNTISIQNQVIPAALEPRPAFRMINIAAIAALSALDRLNNSDVNDLSGVSESACRSFRIEP